MSIRINQAKVLELGITNINQAVVFSFIVSCNKWAFLKEVGDEYFFVVPRQKVCDALPLLNLKPDTVYRHFRKLDDLGLIKYRRLDNCDCVTLTEKGERVLPPMREGWWAAGVSR